MALEKYQRATPNELDSILLRVGMVKRQLELFQDVYDDHGNIIPVNSLTRANELTGAGPEYITSIVEYIYTHFLEVIRKKRNDNPFYDTLPSLEWNAALEIASGGIPGQRERIEIAIMHYHAKPKPVLMIDSDGHLHSRQPFILDFDWGKPEELDKKAAARLARLNKREAEKPDGSARMPIQKITIMAAKPLFEAFFKKSPSTYSFPTGMYAKMWHIANKQKRALVNDGTDRAVVINNLIQRLDTDIYVSAYARYARFIMRHNNLTKDDIKNKKYKGFITIPIFVFCQSVYPSLIHTNGRGELSIDKENFSSFMLNASMSYLSIADFLIYPVFTRVSDWKEPLCFELYTDQNEAIKAETYYQNQAIKAQQLQTLF
jgi:hypothetical protein